MREALGIRPTHFPAYFGGHERMATAFRGRLDTLAIELHHCGEPSNTRTRAKATGDAG